MHAAAAPGSLRLLKLRCFPLGAVRTINRKENVRTIIQKHRLISRSRRTFRQSVHTFQTFEMSSTSKHTVPIEDLSSISKKFRVESFPLTSKAKKALARRHRPSTKDHSVAHRALL